MPRNHKMCGTYCTKGVAEQLSLQETNISQVDEQATSLSEQNVPNGNPRLQRCAGLENALLNAVPTSIKYLGDLIPQTV